MNLLHGFIRLFIRSFIRPFVRFLIFPTTLVAGTGLMIFSMNSQLNIELVALAIAVVTIGIVYASEQVLPFRQEWNKNQGDVKADVTSLAMILMVLEPVIKLLTVWASSLVLIWLGEGLDTSSGITSLFPNEWPLLTQLILFAVVAEFGRYWIHRLSHTQHYLWRVHASHHSPTRIYQFNGYRIHPINHLWNYFLGQFPLIMLGAGEEVVMLYFVFSAIAAAFQHANVDSKNGLLNYVFSTNELHRWHHTTDKTVGHVNFGSVLIVWDLIFGSFFSGKREGKTLGAVGLMSPKNYPINNFARQIAAPFCWKRCVES